MCAAPTAPDLTSISTEALKQAGDTNPSSAKLTRAQTYWMREVKSEIFTRLKNLKPMQKTGYLPTTIGKHRYSNPSDFGSQMNLTLMSGAHTGTAQTGAVGSITLAADEDVTEDFILGKYVLVTSGTGASSCSQVTAYSTSTKVATVTPNFETAPAASSGYSVVDSYYPLKEALLPDYDTVLSGTVRNQPTHYITQGDSDDGEFILYPNPDKVYGLQIRYYADLMNIDLASSQMTYLYQRYENVWIQGVLVRALRGKNETRYLEERQIYDRYLMELQARETYGMDMSNISCRVVDC